MPFIGSALLVVSLISSFSEELRLGNCIIRPGEVGVFKTIETGVGFTISIGVMFSGVGKGEKLEVALGMSFWVSRESKM